MIFRLHLFLHILHELKIDGWQFGICCCDLSMVEWQYFFNEEVLTRYILVEERVKNRIH